jgi:thiol-disulfide isomerase/thioredoxin
MLARMRREAKLDPVRSPEHPDGTPSPTRGIASRRWGAIAVWVALLALVAVAATRLTPGASPGSAGVGSRVIPFRLRASDGRWVSVPRAGRPGAILFAQSTCVSCIQAAQALSRVKARLGSRLDAVMVDVDSREPLSALRGWAMIAGHPTYPLAIDTSGRLAAAYAIEGLGTTIIYDARGQIVERTTDPSLGEIEQGLRKAGVRL